MKSRRTKALDIPPDVKRRVWERDGERCILCGSPDAAPNAHYVARSQGGLGIEENIVTLCWPCHMAYDQSAGRRDIGKRIGRYLRERYAGWNEDALYYKKGANA